MSEDSTVKPAIDAAEDERFMRLALALGRRNLGNTWPNPAVGAVIVKDGLIVARGWTQTSGRPHAEVEALRRAKKAAHGATMYVTLEPCSHHGKTPPCADAISRAGIARVVSAMEDPNPEVAGQGHERLRSKGIAVEIGAGAEEAHQTHVGHITRVTMGRPYVTLKLAISADGKAGISGPQPVQITGEAARERVFKIRATSDAVLVGVGTVLSDNPQLTCRLPGMFDRSPVRVVLDTQLRVPLATSVVAAVRETPTWIFASQEASAMAEEILEQKGCKIFRVGKVDGRLDLHEVLKTLAGQGISRLLVEGGPKVAASFVKADLVDELYLLRGDKSIGANGLPPLHATPIETMTERLSRRESEKLGLDTIEHFVRT